MPLEKITHTYHPFHVELHVTLLALRLWLRLGVFRHGLGLRSLLLLLALRSIGQVGPEADQIILEREREVGEFLKAHICEFELQGDPSG